MKSPVVKGVDRVKLDVIICRNKHVRSSTVPELVFPKHNSTVYGAGCTCSHHSRMRPCNSRYIESAQPVRPRTPSRSSPGQCRDEHSRWKDEVEELPGAVGRCTDVDRENELPHALGHRGEESNALTYQRGRSGRRLQDKIVAFHKKPKSNHAYSSLRNATPFSNSAKTSATGHRALPAEGHVLSKKSQISLSATDTILCVRKGDTRPGAGYRERPGLVVSLGGKETTTTNKSKISLRYCPLTAFDLRVVPPPGRNPNTARKKKTRLAPNTIGTNTRERPRGKARKSSVTETIKDSRHLQSVAAYHDLQHAEVRLDDLISTSLPSKSRPLRSGFCAPLGVSLGT